MRFDVLTLFPALFAGYATQSLFKLALDRGLLELHVWDLRAWSQEKHHKVDDRPYGGGPGMVLMCEPVVEAVRTIQQATRPAAEVIMMTPQGERLTQALVRELSTLPRLLLLCGRYEGFDDRVRQILMPREISVGDFVCNGGEVPAMLVIDTVARFVPGVLGDAASVTEESHSEAGQIEYPHFTRPRVFEGLAVPEVLFSGNHAAVAAWRREQAERRSRERPRHSRPDLAQETPSAFARKESDHE